MRRVIHAFVLVLLLAAPILAAPSVATTSNTTYASRTNTTITAPSGITDGDLLLLFCLTGGGGGTSAAVTIPGTFTALSGSPSSVSDSSAFNVRIWGGYRIASGESGDYTCTHAAGSSQGLMLRVSGANAGAPAFVVTNTGSNTTTTFTGITTPANDTLVVLIGQDWADSANNLTAPTGSTPTFSEHIDTTLVYVASGVLALAGATGNKTMTNNNIQADSRWTAWTLGIEPAAGGSPTVHNILMMGVGQ